MGLCQMVAMIYSDLSAYGCVVASSGVLHQLWWYKPVVCAACVEHTQYNKTSKAWFLKYLYNVNI